MTVESALLNSAKCVKSTSLDCGFHYNMNMPSHLILVAHAIMSSSRTSMRLDSRDKTLSHDSGTSSTSRTKFTHPVSSFPVSQYLTPLEDNVQ